MAGNAGEVAPLGPAAVTIHDDRDVLGQPPRVQLVQQACFFAIERSIRGLEQVRRFHGPNPEDFTGLRGSLQAGIFTPQS